MEKNNKTKSAFKKNYDIQGRNTKSRLAVQKFLSNLQEKESEYSNVNKQITQCVFLGALCLKPVPTDIFQVTLQPISITAQSKSGILYNNTVETSPKNIGDNAVKSEDLKKLKVKKSSRKNSKTSSIQTDLFIGNICEQKPGNKILELFNNRHLSIVEKVHSESSKVSSNEKCNKETNIKYKIKVGGILSQNKKNFKKYTEELPLRKEKQTVHNLPSIQTVSGQTKVEFSEIKPALCYKLNQPEIRELKKCKLQSKDNNSNVNNTISSLFFEKCKRDSNVQNSIMDNAIERLKKKRDIEVKKVTKMETKSKSIPCKSGNGSAKKSTNRTKTGHLCSIINLVDGSNKSEPSYLKEASVDLSEIVDDEIEDYLEIDQNIVADLEALIPEEEIESISNTFINSANVSNPVFSNCKKSETNTCSTKEKPLKKTKIVQSEEILLVNTGKSSEMIEEKIEDDNFNKDYQDKKPARTLPLDENKIGENIVLYNRTEKSKPKSEDSLSNKQKVSKHLNVEAEHSKHSKRVKLVQSSPQKLSAKLKKHSKVEPKLDISKKIRKITDFLFPVKTTENNTTHKNVNDKSAEKEDSKNMTVVFLKKTSNNLSSNLNKEGLCEMRTLRSCKKSLRDEATKIKKIGLTKQSDVKGPSMLSPESEVVFICKNDSMLQEQKLESIDTQSNETTTQILPASTEKKSPISVVSLQKPISVRSVQIGNLKSTPVKNNIPKKKKLIESKKIKVSKTEKFQPKKILGDDLQSERKIDIEINVMSELQNKVEKQSNTNEDSGSIVKDSEEVHSKLENSYKEKRKEECEKSSSSLKESTCYNKSTNSEVTICSETSIAEIQVKPIVISNNKIEPDNAIIMEKQYNLSEHSNSNNSRVQGGNCGITRKIFNESGIEETNFIDSLLENRKLNTCDTKPSREINESILKTEEHSKISSLSLPSVENQNGEKDGDLKYSNLSEFGKRDSLNEVYEKMMSSEKQFATIQEHNTELLKVRCSQENELAKTASKTRFQLRKKKAEETPNEKVLSKTICSENNSQNIISNIKENTLNSNVSRNTRKNKKLESKVNLKKIKLKNDPKNLSKKKVEHNKRITNNKTTGLKMSIQQKTKNIKIFKTKNQIKGGRVVKRITKLRKAPRMMIIEKNNHLKTLTKADDNKADMSNKKGKKVIKSTGTEIQSSAEIGKNTEKLGKILPISSHNLSNQSLSYNDLKISDPANSHPVALIEEHNNKIRKINNRNKKYTFRNRKNNIEKKNIISKIRNVVDNLTKLNKIKIEMNNANAIIKDVVEVNVFQQQQNETVPQACLSETTEIKSGDKKDNLSTSVITSENKASVSNENLTNIRDHTIERPTSKIRKKKTWTKSLNFKSQYNVRSLMKQETKFSVDTKNQLNEEKAGSIKEDKTLNNGKKLDIQHGKTDNSKESDDKMENACAVPHVNYEGNEKINCFIFKATSCETSTSQNENISSNNIRQNTEYDKSSVSELPKDGHNIGISQDEVNMNHLENPKRELQQKTENVLKIEKKIDSPTNIILAESPKNKSGKKYGLKKKSDGFPKQDRTKLKMENDGKAATMEDSTETTLSTIHDQNVLTADITNYANKSHKEKNEAQFGIPVVKIQPNIEVPHCISVLEKPKSLVSEKNTSCVTNIEKKKLQCSNEIKSSSFDEILIGSPELQQNNQYNPLDEVATTRNVQDIEQIFVQGVPNVLTNNENISTEELCEESNDSQSEVQTSKVKVTIGEGSPEPKRRKYRKSDSQDQMVNIKQVAKKKQKNVTDESNVNLKIEIGLSKLSQDKIEDNCNISYALKGDLSNSNSKLSQEIERRMQTEFTQEFPNFGSSAPERYRRIYRCRICLVVCETYGKLKLHRRIHDVATPYQCQQCDKSYDDVEDLAAHLRIHKGEMPYPCKKCDSSFWTSLQLERHQMVHVLKKVAPANNSAPKKVFKCEVCGKEFKKICDLERHTRVHTGEKPSVCNICDKRFQQAYNLHKHLLTHTQEKNYECIICQKRFGRSDVLNRHVLTHSIDKPFHCSICLKTFIRSSQLKLHLRKHHDMSSEEADAAVALSTSASAGQDECPPPHSNAQDKKDVVACSTSAEQAQVCAF